MIFSERISLSKSTKPQAPQKKFINIVDQESDDLLLRLSVHPCLSIIQLKQKLQKKIGGSIAKIRLRYRQQILSNNNASIADYHIKNESEVFYTPLIPLESIGMIRSYDNDPRTIKAMSKALAEIRKALHNKIIPKITQSGVSGSYFIENIDRNNVAIFKPLDEEPYAPNNPKGYVGKLGQKGIRSGIRSGEQGYREVVAYLLDSTGFHEVPPTSFVEFYHPAFKFNEKLEDSANSGVSVPSFIDSDANKRKQMKLLNEQIKRGSLQLFVQHNDECGNYGNSIFSTEEVHKIAILDIRILNCDRNDQNILVKKKKKKCQLTQEELKRLPSYKQQQLEFDFNLIPIDHGLSLPDSFEICSDNLNWMWWDQAEHPLSKKSLDFIREINIENDLRILQTKFNLREECLRNFRIANTVLKEGVKQGLNLQEIGKILYRPDTDEESTVEKMIADVKHYAAICLKGGNSDIIKNKIKKDMARNQLRQQIEMPVITENVILEQVPLFDSNSKQSAESAQTTKLATEVATTTQTSKESVETTISGTKSNSPRTPTGLIRKSSSEGTHNHQQQHQQQQQLSEQHLPNTNHLINSDSSTRPSISSGIAVQSPTSFTSSSSSQTENKNPPQSQLPQIILTAEQQSQQFQKINLQPLYANLLTKNVKNESILAPFTSSQTLNLPTNEASAAASGDQSNIYNDFSISAQGSLNSPYHNLELREQVSGISAVSGSSEGSALFKISRSFSLPLLESARLANATTETPNANGHPLARKKAINGSDSKRSVQFSLNGSDSNKKKPEEIVDLPDEDDDDDDYQQNKIFKVNSLSVKLNPHKKAQEKKVQEEVFFYYFDQVLQAHFEKIKQEKAKLARQRPRGRFNSEEISVNSTSSRYN